MPWPDPKNSHFPFPLSQSSLHFDIVCFDAGSSWLCWFLPKSENAATGSCLGVDGLVECHQREGLGCYNLTVLEWMWGAALTRIALNASRLQLVASCRRLVVLHSSQFRHILADEGRTNQAYAGDPLAGFSFCQRGLMFETLARQMLARARPNRLIQDADVQCLGTCVNGRRRALYSAEWDWVCMGRRAELKTAQLCFNAREKSWSVAFLAVKLSRDGLRAEQPFDDLFLMIYAPDGFYLIQHDLATGVSKDGVRTSSHGHVIRVRAKRGQTCWKAALLTILYKLTSQGCCEMVGYAAKSDPLSGALYAELLDRAVSPTHQVYEGIPLGSTNAIIRAHRIQQIARELDQHEHPDSLFESAKGEKSPCGIRRGDSNAAVDWVRDGVRVEVKSSKLSFDSGTSRWMCRFSNIKTGNMGDGRNAYFDELWLAIYSPDGMDFFKHWNWQARLCSAGKRTASMGNVLKIAAGKQFQSPSNALESIKAQLEKDGAEHHFTVRWGE